MKAKLKKLHSPDVDLKSFFPENPKHFGFLLQAMIGPDNEEGGESFSLEVCTPSWLASNHKANDVLFGSNLLIVFQYDFQKIEDHISRYCDRCTEEDWITVATKLARVAQWEFEDYLPSSQAG